MEEELALHLEMVADDWQRRGLTREEAIRQARLQAGGIAQAMEQRRDQRGLPWLEDLLQDARFGARMLRRAPLVTAVALVTLTLAIGANSAIFSLVDPLLFRDRARPRSGQPGAVHISVSARPAAEHVQSRAATSSIATGTTSFSDVFGLAPLTTQSRAGGDPIARRGGHRQFLPGAWRAAGARARAGAVGRQARRAAGRRGELAVLEESIQWRRASARLCHRYRRHPRARADACHGGRRGRTRGFSGIVVGYRPDVWISLSAVPDAMRSRAALALIARLKPGASIEQARAEMRVLDRARIEALAKRDPQWLRVADRRHAGAHRTLDAAAPAVWRAADAADDDGRRRAAAGVRQHRRPAARARGRAAAGDGGPGLARRRSFPHRAAGADRIAASGFDGRHPGRRSARDSARRC